MRSIHSERAFKLLFVGGIPPPYGGVNIHISRLCRFAADRGASVEVADLHASEPRADSGCQVVPMRARFAALRLLRSILKADVVHIHTSGARRIFAETAIALVARALRRGLAMTIHGGGFSSRIGQLSRARKAMLRFLFSLCNLIIVVNPQQQTAISFTYGTRFDDAIVVIPAYLPPELELSPPPAPPPVNLLCAGGWTTTYGFDTLVDALSMLSEDVAEWRLTIVPHSVEAHDPKFRSDVSASIDGLGDKVQIIDHSLPPSELYAHFHMYVRPTRLDGDSLMVREALDLGLYVIASDCVSRPQGCLVSKAGDPRSLSNAIEEGIRTIASGNLPSKRTPDNRWAEQLFALLSGLR